MPKIALDVTVWMQRVYDAVGKSTFVVSDLDGIETGTGVVRIAHNRELISKVGKGKHNEAVWEINPHNMKKWRRSV